MYEDIEVAPEQMKAAEQAAVHAKTIAGEITEAWTSEIRDHFPHLAGNEEHNQALVWAAHIITATTIFKSIRYEATGISTARSTWSAPHQHCAAQIARTRQWTRHVPLSPFAEGKGYCADHDPIREGSAANKMIYFDQ